IQLPPVLVALSDFVGGFQLLVVLVLHAQRLANVVDDVLIGGGVIAAWRFFAGEERVDGIDVRIAGGEIFHPAPFAQVFSDFGAVRARAARFGGARFRLAGRFLADRFADRLMGARRMTRRAGLARFAALFAFELFRFAIASILSEP